MRAPSPGPESSPESSPEKQPGHVADPRRAPRGRTLPRAFSSLRQRNFRLFWSGQLVSLIGTFMQGIGQAWLVLELTHSALQLGLVGALQSLGVLLFSVFGGVFADRWPKRRILLCTQTAAMLQAAALWALIASGAIQLWHIYILATLLWVTNSLDLPTRQAFLVEMVGREDLTNAVALNSSLVNLTRIIGPSIGGVIIAASGVAALFLLNAASYLAVLLGLALIDSRALHAQAARPAGERQTTWRSLREGLDYIWQTPAISLLIVVVGLVLLFGSNFNILLPLFATNVLHTGSRGFGFLSGALSVGAFIGALWLASGARRPGIGPVLLGAVAFSVLEGAFALSRSFPLSLALIATVGFAETSFAALAIVMLQSIAPDHLRGRVMSAYILFFDGSVPAGYLLVGWLSQTFGAPSALLLCALLSLCVVALGWLWRQRVAPQEAAKPTS